MDFLNVPLGWKTDVEDKDALIASAVEMPEVRSFAAPPEISHRAWYKVKQQGQMGSCVGHGLSEAEEISNYIDTGGDVIRCSAMFAYLRSQAYSNLLGKDQGATISGSVEAAKEDGAVLEEHFPYPSRYTTTIPEAARVNAGKHKILRHSPIKSYDDAFKWLATGQGVVIIGVDWTRSLANNNGVIEDAGSGSYGGHCMLLAGYTKRRDRSDRQYLDLLNSHGEGWGNRGWAEVAPRVIEQWLDQRWAELWGLSDIEEFGVRPVPDFSKMFEGIV